MQMVNAYLNYVGAIALLIMLILPSKPSGEVYGPYHDSMSY